MKFHLFHFTPCGIVKAYSHLIAGYRLCKATSMSLWPFIPDSVNSMTAAYNVFNTFNSFSLPIFNTIIDIGANVSQMTKLLVGINKNTDIISFEPNNKLKPIGDVHRMAISDVNGPAKFCVCNNDSVWGTINATDESIVTESYPITTARLDTLINSNVVDWDNVKRPVLLKVDVEGCEYKAIKGAGRYLADIDYLLVEVENIEERGHNYDLMSLCSLLANHGFKQSKIVYSCYVGSGAPVYSDILFWK